ncbi:alanine:cation symporter family protein [Actinomycetaceae bacterium TAE3-ERU4]|nr:alanine:cation symporter family protein [Actinomycetaceae bacterium TAE3-ERU4]
MELISKWVGLINDYLYGYLLVYLLLGVGVFLTFYLACPQVRLFRPIFTSLKGSKNDKNVEVSSFQAFAVGVGTRVGIGNIGGVALALILGGPGAIFWMWVVALIGMSTALAESTLAQIFKVRSGPGAFRGGPAYYISQGLNSKVLAVAFAAITVFASGIAVPMVQINALSSTLEAIHGIKPIYTAIIVVILLAPVILGGLRSIARVSEMLVPAMAIIYLTLTIVVIALNPLAALSALKTIVLSAFGVQSTFAGIGAGIFVALINGARRGLFSNEAGLGTSPNAAGTAAGSHPVNQGLVQALGVFIDTILVCTATALLILITGPDLLSGTPLTPDDAGSLTAQALTHSFGAWIGPLVSLIIFIFAYTSAFGAYSYGQVSLDYLSRNKFLSWGYRVLVLIACAYGAVKSLALVWSISDIFLGLGAILNLYALIRLAPWVKVALRDWVAQGKGSEAVFKADKVKLPGELKSDIWY